MRLLQRLWPTAVKLFLRLLGVCIFLAGWLIDVSLCYWLERLLSIVMYWFWSDTVNWRAMEKFRRKIFFIFESSYKCVNNFETYQFEYIYLSHFHAYRYTNLIKLLLLEIKTSFSWYHFDIFELVFYYHLVGICLFASFQYFRIWRFNKVLHF